MTSYQFNPGDVDIQSILMSNVDHSTEIDIMGQVSAIDVYESIFSPTLYAEFFLIDGIDLLNTFPIVGEEQIELTFKSSTNEPKTYTFHVVQPSDIQDIASEKAKQYKLRCFSEEHLINQTNRFTKKYNTTGDNIVQDIIRNMLKTDKDIVVEKTKGIESLIVPKLHPLEAIDMIKQRAVSAENVSSSYVFFENAMGFYFITIEKLMFDGANQSEIVKFSYNQAALLDLNKSIYRNVLGLSRSVNTNTVQKLNSGKKYGVKTFDVLTGKIASYEYNNDADQSKFKFASATNPNNTSKFEEKYQSKGQSQVYFVPKDGSKPDNFIEQKVLFNTAYQQKLMSDSTVITVWGDSNLLAGQVVECELPTGSPAITTSANESDRLYAGNYLIHSLRHSMQLGGVNRKYYCALGLLKGNYEDVT